MVLIGGDLMNAYLRIKEYNDSYTATEKLIAEYILENDILQDSAQALGEKLIPLQLLLSVSQRK